MKIRSETGTSINVPKQQKTTVPKSKFKRIAKGVQSTSAQTKSFKNNAAARCKFDMKREVSIRTKGKVLIVNTS